MIGPILKTLDSTHILQLNPIKKNYFHIKKNNDFI